MDPIVKWAGGKRRLVDEIISLFPDDYEERRYHEPMIGGGAVFFHLEPKEGSINDINEHLMRFYRIVRDKPEKLIERAKEHEYDEDYYYEARDRYNQDESLSPVERVALFLYFNKTGYNGLWRVNSDGEFNVPFGNYSDPTIVDEDAIYSASRVLKDVKIYEQDFDYIIDEAREGDIVYFDPPYQPVSETADFTEYTKGGFDVDCQKRLHHACKELNKEGVIFVLSNSYAKPVREMYENTDEFWVEEVEARRYINCKGDGRSPVKEILAHNMNEGEKASLTG